VICQGGFRSLRAAQFLQQAGFGQVLNVAGGTSAWAEAGYPVERSDAAPAVPTRIAETQWAHAGASI
jgi:3-mercaptopyruvate sulfurtransferase SseA